MPSFTVYKGSSSGAITKGQTTKPDLDDDQVLVKVTASGLCGTDLHYRGVDMALGHEGVGTIEAVGPRVRNMKKGDRVGWGYQHNSCGECKYCLSGRETFCAERAMYGSADLDQGSFASHAVWRESFLYRIPDGLTDAEAAPLMCGGATVWGAIAMYGIKSTDHVGIMGVGGLGHLAIQFANKMGCRVTVLSGTESKKDEAEKLGATGFIAMKGKKAGEIELEKKLDALLVTTSAQPDWSVVLPLMNRDSIILPLSVSMDNLVIPYLPLLLDGIRVQGSLVAPRGLHQQMLDFAAQHSIKPILMHFPLSEEGIEKGMKTLDDGAMRYRGVLVPQ